MSLTYTLTAAQYKALSGLAYWIADENYIRERHGAGDPEITKCRDTICKCLFPECDNLKIPFWVQNTVICWSEDYRNYINGYLYKYLESKNIYREV